MTRRARSDSLTAAQKMMNSSPPSVPDHIKLRPCDIPFWNGIMSVRDNSSWTSAELEHAANLARCKADIERVQLELQKEGDIIENKRGTMVMNPKHTLIEILTRRSVALTKLLMVHAQATLGDTSDTKKRNTAQKKVNEIVDIFEDDELLASPKH